MFKNNNSIIPEFTEGICCPACASTNTKQELECTIREEEINLINNIYKHLNSKEKVSNFYDSKIQICLCLRCKLRYHKNIPDEKTLSYVYSELIDENLSFEKYKSKENFTIRKSITLLSRLKKIIQSNTKNNINYLDFGFGWGPMLKASKHLKLIPYGIEQNIKQIDLMKKQGIKTYQKINNLENNEKELKKFSIITLNQVLEHLTNPNEILYDLSKICKKKSILYIAVPPYISKKNIKKNDLFKKGPIQPFEHINCFSRKSMELLAKNTNWQLLTFKIFVKRFFYLSKNYNIFIILIVIIRQLINRGTYYLIPKI